MELIQLPFLLIGQRFAVAFGEVHTATKVCRFILTEQSVLVDETGAHGESFLDIFIVRRVISPEHRVAVCTVNYDMNNLNAGGKGRFSYDIEGVLDYALYEDVVFTFEVSYYTDGQKEEDYQSYTMKIGCNAAGNAKFETNHLGLTNVTVGKWLGTDGELVSFENYNWKVHFLSVTGKVIYTQ